MADKDIQSMVDTAAGHFDAWFLGDQPDNKRAARGADIATLLSATAASVRSVSKNLQLAFREAQSVCGTDDRLVVFGSFYTVAAVLPLLDKDI